MIDLKPYYDAVMAADEQVQTIAGQINELFVVGTDESKLQALALRPQLEEAQAKYNDAVVLYQTIENTNRPNDVAKNFVPVSQTDPTEVTVNQPSVIKRADYDRMSLVDRANFIKSGGTLQD